MIKQDEFIENLKSILISRIEDGKLVLPVLPAISVQVQQELNNPNVDLKKVSTILSRDPVLTAQILQLANSAAYARAQKCETISKAVTLLGVRNLKNILMSASAKQVFTSRIPHVKETMKSLWEHAIAVALLAQDIATVAGSQDVELAYLAGLLHDIGQPVVAIYLLEVEKTLLEKRGINARTWLDDAGWLKTVESIHQPVGKALVKRWNLPDAVGQAIEECHDYNPVERLAAVNMVRLADSIAKRAGIYVGAVDHDEIGTILLVGRSILGIDEEVIDRLTNEIEARVAS